MSFAIKVKKPVNLGDIPTNSNGGLTEDVARLRTSKLGEELAELQSLMYAAGTHSLLVILQARDTGGKDGTIRNLSRNMNVQSVHVKSFKVPTTEEAGHDFLWRAHPHAPVLGSVSIFNRSYYEDVIVVRVHDLVPKHIWKARFEQINAFESLLDASNTIILKLCLHISKDEQAERLKARELDDTKAWKLSVGDWEERALWDEYTKAYSDALSECSPKHARWHVVPADHKWFRDLAVTDAIVKTLRPYRDDWEAVLKAMGEKARGELDAFHATEG